MLQLTAGGRAANQLEEGILHQVGSGFAMLQTLAQPVQQPGMMIGVEVVQFLATYRG
ncbi:hypothetical protein D3C80_1639690 [compost metagenome]